MRINDLFAIVAASTEDGGRRRRMYDVLRTVLRNRGAWGVENTAADLVRNREFIESRLSTQPQVRALRDVLDLAAARRPSRPLRLAGALVLYALVAALAVACVRYARGAGAAVDRWPSLSFAEVRGATSFIAREAVHRLWER